MNSLFDYGYSTEDDEGIAEMIRAWMGMVTLDSDRGEVKVTKLRLILMFLFLFPFTEVSSSTVPEIGLTKLISLSAYLVCNRL